MSEPSSNAVRDVMAKLAERGRRGDAPPDEIDPDQIPYDIYRHQRADLARIANRLYLLLVVIAVLLGLLLWRVW